MIRKKAKSAWSRTITESGVKVRLYRRRPDGVIYREIRLGNGAKDRKSLKTSDPDEAETQAKEFAKELALLRLTGADPRRLTLAHVFAAYFARRGPELTDSWRKAAETRRSLFQVCWGKDTVVVDISQTDVDRFARLRRTGTLTSLGKGKGRGDRRPVNVRAGTVDGDLRWLSSVFNWARKHKDGGRRLLPENPLHDVHWAKEENPRRPVASHDRFQHTMRHVDSVDPTGRLRCILSLARYTGRRADAICQLRVVDVLRTPMQSHACLAGSGMNVGLVDHMPHGAVRWSDKSDKMGFLFVSPLSIPAREALDKYLRGSLRLGDAPLFPSDDTDADPIRRDVVASWLVRAEQKAKLPKLHGGIWHPYRRLWASERKSLADVDVAAAGGWKDTRALKLSYQQADAAAVLDVVNFGA